ncbi:hypothetical protein K1719_032068 [Acacia pycnantha]|nr:hypothetical protein K1719_032068 [Acacia pycnantha]
MPLEWINNYEEEFHSTPVGIHITAPPLVQRMPDGTVKSIFQKPRTEGSFLLSGTMTTITPVYKSKEHPLVDQFTKEGKPVFVSHVNGHFKWDLDYRMFEPDCDFQYLDFWDLLDDEDLIDFTSKRNCRKKSKGSSCSHFDHQRYNKGNQAPKLKVSRPIPIVPTKELTIRDLLKELGHNDLAAR